MAIDMVLNSPMYKYASAILEGKLVQLLDYKRQLDRENCSIAAQSGPVDNLLVKICFPSSGKSLASSVALLFNHFACVER